MTFDEIVSRIAARLNITSAASITRIGQSVNERYKRLASSMGLQTTVRAQVTANTVIGSRFVSFAGEKVVDVYYPSVNPTNILDLISANEMRTVIPGTNKPGQRYCEQLMGASTVTIQLDVIPGTVYAYGADVYANQATLAGANTPAFAESFHDILEVGGMAVELDKMKDYEGAKVKETEYKDRLGELRLYIAKNGYLDLYQGKTRVTQYPRQLV